MDTKKIRACSQLLPDPGGEVVRECLDEIERLREDAARYRFLRDSKNAYPMFFIAQRDPNNLVVQFTGELTDMNIDEMMKTPNDQGKRPAESGSA